MSMVIFDHKDSLHGMQQPVLGTKSLLKRVLRALPRTGSKPGWARVSKRAWRRNSALLTYMHEAQTGEP